MSDDFLTRWSRRKHAARVEVAPRTPKEDAPAPPPAPVPAAAAAPPENAIDPATLPPIESITALTDIRDFLSVGVPPELTRAALRRVWHTDPAIRDFVGLSENAWDFTDPNAMPGFGPLESTDQIRELVEQIVGKVQEGADITNARANDALASVADDATPAARSSPGEQSPAKSPQTDDSSEPSSPSRPDHGAAAQGKRDVAAQQDESGDKSRAPGRLRSRGRALPQ